MIILLHKSCIPGMPWIWLIQVNGRWIRSRDYSSKSNAKRGFIRWRKKFMKESVKLTFVER